MLSNKQFINHKVATHSQEVEIFVKYLESKNYQQGDVLYSSYNVLTKYPHGSIEEQKLMQLN